MSQEHPCLTAKRQSLCNLLLIKLTEANNRLLKPVILLTPLHNIMWLACSVWSRDPDVNSSHACFLLNQVVKSELCLLWMLAVCRERDRVCKQLFRALTKENWQRRGEPQPNVLPLSRVGTHQLICNDDFTNESWAEPIQTCYDENGLVSPKFCNILELYRTTSGNKQSFEFFACSLKTELAPIIDSF